MEDNVFVVTVTYGNRFHLLKQVIDAVLNEGAQRVIVVDNNSEPESREKLREYERSSSRKVEVLYLEENLGSAGGFRRALEKAYSDPGCELVWLLDDDNKPAGNALRTLLDFWKSLDIENKKELVALLSYRSTREQLEYKSIVENKPELLLIHKNSFLGFHIKLIHKKILGYLTRALRPEKNWQERNHKARFGVVPVAPYGGLFFHKKILDKIGYPKEELYLYKDDHEWTYRITKSGGRIYLLLDSEIRDLEISWSVPQSSAQTMFSMLAKGDPFKVYYHVRNSVFFEVNNLVENKFTYWINVFVYLVLLGLASLRNMKLIIRAINDGYKGRLGRLEP